MRLSNVLALGVLALGLGLSLMPGEQQPTAPDNTKTNTRDRNPAAVTADQQKENPPIEN